MGIFLYLFYGSLLLWIADLPRSVFLGSLADLPGSVWFVLGWCFRQFNRLAQVFYICDSASFLVRIKFLSNRPCLFCKLVAFPIGMGF